MKAKVSYGMCSISVIGMDIACPFCQTVVKSGQQHQCQPPAITVKPTPRKKRRAISKLNPR